MIYTLAIKKTLPSAFAGLAAVGLTPKDASDITSIFIGLFVGTLARWCYERSDGVKLAKGWLTYQVGMLGIVGLAVFYVAEAADLPGRLIPLVAGIGAFGVREWLNRKKKQIESGDIG